MQIADYVTVGGGGTPSIATSPEPRIHPGHRGADDADHPHSLRPVVRRRSGRALRADRRRRRVGGGADPGGGDRTPAGAAAAAGFHRAAGGGRHLGRRRPGAADHHRRPATGRFASATRSAPDPAESRRPRTARRSPCRCGRMCHAAPRSCCPSRSSTVTVATARPALTVTVTGSRKPLPTVIDQQIAQGRAGVQVSADLLTGSIDPVGLGLTVTSVTVVEGNGGVAAGPTMTGSTVQLTPAAGFVGDIVVAAEVLRRHQGSGTGGDGTAAGLDPGPAVRPRHPGCRRRHPDGATACNWPGRRRMPTARRSRATRSSGAGSGRTAPGPEVPVSSVVSRPGSRMSSSSPPATRSANRTRPRRPR